MSCFCTVTRPHPGGHDGDELMQASWDGREVGPSWDQSPRGRFIMAAVTPPGQRDLA